MKKASTIYLCLFLLISFTLTIYAQPNKEVLNQPELLKQLIGTWEGRLGGDTVVRVNITPHGGALNYTREVKVMGNTINMYTGIYGLSQDKKTIISTSVSEDGTMYFDYARFVSDKKLVAEMYFDNLEHPVAIEEIEFLSPDSFVVRSKWRGLEMSWDMEWTPLWTFLRVE